MAVGVGCGDEGDAGSSGEFGLEIAGLTSAPYICPEGLYQLWCEASCNHQPSVCPANLCGGCVQTPAPTPEPEPSSALVVCPEGPFERWCEASCNHEPSVCPENLCGACVDTSQPDASRSPAREPEPTNVSIVCPATQYQQWCEDVCNHEGGYCPAFLCGECVATETPEQTSRGAP